MDDGFARFLSSLLVCGGILWVIMFCIKKIIKWWKE